MPRSGSARNLSRALCGETFRICSFPPTYPRFNPRPCATGRILKATRYDTFMPSDRQEVVALCVRRSELVLCVAENIGSAH